MNVDENIPEEARYVNVARQKEGVQVNDNRTKNSRFLLTLRYFVFESSKI